jgi:uncharacterized protein
MFLKLIVFGVIAYFIYKSLGGKVNLPGRNAKETPPKEAGEDADTLVECEVCSTFVTAKDAIYYKGRYYCSAECLEKSKGA